MNELKTKIRNLLKRLFSKQSLTDRIRNAVVDMMRKVDFDEVEHRYTRKSDGEWLAGVTEVSSAAGYKEARGWMPAWGGKEAVKLLGYFDKIKGENHDKDFENLKEIIKSIGGMNEGEFLKLLRKAKSGHAIKSGKAKDVGKECHAYLEKWTLANIREEKLPEIPKYGEFIENGIKKYFEWVENNVDKFILSEARLAIPGRPYEYAGTCDAVALMKNGNLAVIDYKFADNVSIAWQLQTEAYARTFKPYGIDVNERYAIRFPKTEFKLIWNKDEFIHEKIKNEFQIISYPNYEKDFDFETFLYYRYVGKWVNSRIKLQKSYK